MRTDEVVTVPLSLAFEDFYAASYARIAAGVAATVGDADLAADATDEAMTRAYPRWERIGGYDNPAGWVYRVAVNWATSRRARLRRRLPWREPTTVELGPLADPELDAAIRSLPIEFRSVVVCRFLLDWSVDQTADALDVSPGTVKSRLSRALDRLRAEVQDA
ncbi:MAG: sigma factor-like helix-turn-helix DNA-binding protein [Actinomycetota bacterium]